MIKRFSVIITAVLLAVSVAWADELALVETISSPDSDIQGLACESGYIWVSYGGSASVYAGMIVKIDMSGNVITSFNAPGKVSSVSETPATAGLAFDGTYLWNINYLDNKLYKITKTGEIIGSITIPSYCYSVTWDGKNLWIVNKENNKVYKINQLSGEILYTIDAPGWEKDIEPDGLAYDGEYLWVSNNYGKKICSVDPQSGETVTEYSNLFSYGTAEALTWDGQYLFIGGSASSGIKKYKVMQPPEGYSNPTME